MLTHLNFLLWIIKIFIILQCLELIAKNEMFDLVQAFSDINSDEHYAVDI